MVRSGCLVGRNMPTVRLLRVRNFWATRPTSSGVTFSRRSRYRKYSRQSPIAAHSLSSIAIWSDLDAPSSRNFKSFSLMRSTSSWVTPFLAIPRRVSSIVPRTTSGSLPAETSAMIRITPGSCQANAAPETVEAFLDSTSDL